MLSARILGTSSLLPGRAVETSEVAARAMPEKPKGWLEGRTGIRTRYWAPPGTRAADLGAEALRRALDAAELPPEALRRILFVSSAGGDTLLPASANAVADALGVYDTCDAFDVNNACVGFLTALDIAARSAATGLSPVGIVVVELGSAFITPEDPRPYAVLGDAAAAVVVGPGRPGEGVLSVKLGNNGASGRTVVLDHPRFPGARRTVSFAIPSREMGRRAIELITGSVRAVLAEAELPLSSVEWLLFHQPNGPMFDAFVEALGARGERTVRVVHEIGSVAAASIPVSLDRLFRSRRVRPGDRILMAAVGSGVSYGSILYQSAPA